MPRSDFDLSDATSGYQNRAKQPGRGAPRLAPGAWHQKLWHQKLWHQCDALVDQSPRKSPAQRRLYTINQGRSWVEFALTATAPTKKERFMPEWRICSESCPSARRPTEPTRCFITQARASVRSNRN